MQSGVFFLQHGVILRLHDILLDPTLDIFVLFTRLKRMVWIVLYVLLTANLSVAFPLVSNVIAQWNTGARECFRPQQRRRRWLRLRVGDVFKEFQVGERVQVFD
jgi:hypothetical protein